jgi:hypothetical protein
MADTRKKAARPKHTLGDPAAVRDAERLLGLEGVGDKLDTWKAIDAAGLGHLSKMGQIDAAAQGIGAREMEKLTGIGSAAEAIGARIDKLTGIGDATSALDAIGAGVRASIGRMDSAARAAMEAAAWPIVTVDVGPIRDPQVIAMEGVQSQVEALDEAVGTRLDGILTAQRESAELLGAYVEVFKTAHASDRHLARIAVIISTLTLVVSAVALVVALIRPS